MQIAAIMLAHNNPELVKDTIESIQMWGTNNIILVLDGINEKNFDKFQFENVKSYVGFIHNHPSGPYKNYCLGFKKAYEEYPDMDWYWYIEPDCLVISDRFKQELQEKNSYGCLGFEYNNRYNDLKLPFLNEIMGEKVTTSRHIIGCCTFYKRYFIDKIYQKIDLLLDKTKHFEKGAFPDYHGYGFEEDLFPSLVAHFGGTIGQMNRYNYNIRWQPCWRSSELSGAASIIHPIKKIEDIRIHYKKIRDILHARFK